MNNITVVVLRSLSFTGTTWINCLLGCHKRSFALGPPDPVLRLYEEGDKEWKSACRVHAEECTLWPEFAKQYNPKENFYLQLADFSGRDYIVINNPIPTTKATKDLKHPNIAVKEIHIVRDGRAVCSSFVDKNPDKDFLYSIRSFFYPSASTFYFDEQDPDTLCFRYEDVVADQKQYIHTIGRFIGLTYPENANRFWEFDHHLTAGNRSLSGMIRRFQLDRPFPEKYAFYEKEYQRLCREPDQPIVDERWKDRLGRWERFLFDVHAGDVNEYWGYPRDGFTAREFEAFQKDFEKQGGQPMPPFDPAKTAIPAPVEFWMWRNNGKRIRSLAQAGGVIPGSLLKWALHVTVLSWIGSLLIAVLLAILITWLVVS